MAEKDKEISKEKDKEKEGSKEKEKEREKERDKTNASDHQEIINSIVTQYSNPREEICFSAWLEIGAGQGKKMVRKLCCVGKYRLFLVKKGLFGKLSLEKDVPLLHLKELREEGQETLVLEFSQGTDLTYRLKSSLAKDIIKHIRSNIRIISCGAPAERFRVNVYPEMLLELDPSYRPSPAGGLYDAYLARANYLSKLPRESLARFVADLEDLRLTDFVLADYSGADDSSEASAPLSPLLSALAFNSYFRSLISRDVAWDQGGGDVAALGQALRSNQHIIKLVVSNARISDVSELGSALTFNAGHCLTHLDLSRNALGDKGVTLLAEGLHHFTHGLEELNLEHCNISPRGTQALFDAFNKNYQMSASIKHLYVGGNQFVDLGTAQFIRWLDAAKSHLSLRRLSVAGVSSLNFTGILKNLAPCGPKLQWLDLSRNKIADEDLDTLSIVFAALRTNEEPMAGDTRIFPTSLRLSQTQLSIIALTTLFGFIARNGKLGSVALDLSGLDIGAVGAVQLAPAVKNCPQLRALSLADCKLKPKGVAAILDSAQGTLGNLVLDQNWADVRDGSDDIIAHAAVRWLQRVPNGARLSLKGGPRAHLRRSLLPLLDALRSNSSLTALDISFNWIGDLAAWKLGESLRENKALTRLQMDRNHLSLSGWKAMMEALGRNKGLRDVTVPSHDWEKAASSLPDHRRGEVFHLSAVLQSILSRNAMGEGGPLELSEAVKFRNREALLPLDFCTAIADRLGIASDIPAYEYPTPTTVAPFPTHLPDYLKNGSEAPPALAASTPQPSPSVRRKSVKAQPAPEPPPELPPPEPSRPKASPPRESPAEVTEAPLQSTGLPPPPPAYIPAPPSSAENVDEGDRVGPEANSESFEEGADDFGEAPPAPPPPPPPR